MFAIVIVLSACMLVSCGGGKQLGYRFEGLSDTTKIMLPEMKYPQSVIQPDDILEIRITGANKETVADINSKGNSFNTASGGGIGYLVDKDGFVELYLIGRVKVSGLTKQQARDVLLTETAKYLKDPGVVLRFVNFRFTILGEVKAPGTQTAANEKISLLEAISMSGDFTANAKRNVVRIIRDSSGVREIGTVNFNQKTLFTSPYYYLHRNDVIVVERDSKGQTTQILSTVSSIVGIVTSIITLYYIINK